MEKIEIRKRKKERSERKMVEKEEGMKARSERKKMKKWVKERWKRRKIANLIGNLVIIKVYFNSIALTEILLQGAVLAVLHKCT